MSIVIVKGDKGFNISFTVLDSDGAAVDLTTVSSVTFKMKKLNATTNKVSGACVVVSATDGTCTYTVGSADMDTIGTYQAELVLTYSASKVISAVTEDIVVVEDLV